MKTADVVPASSAFSSGVANPLLRLAGLVVLAMAYACATFGQAGTLLFVQGAANYGNKVGSVSAALGSPVTSGHLLVAAVGYSDSKNIGNVTFTVTDSLGNAWTSAMSPVRRSTHGVAQIFYVKSSNGGNDTVKVTPSIGNASFLEVFVHEYSGTDPNAPLDVTANGQGNSKTPDSGAAATTGTNEVIFGFALLTHPGGAGAGFTARETYGGDVSEDEMASSAGSYSALFTQPATGEWIALMAAFRASSGASNPTVASVTLNPTTVVGGNSSQGTVTLSGPAPTSGATVMLTSSSGSAMVPLSITIGSGMTSGTFTVNTSTVSTPTQATITASYDGTQTAILVINSVSGTQTVFVQGAANYGTGVGSISAGLGSPVTSGHLLVAAVGYSDSTNIPNVTFTVTDSLGNTWTSAMTPVRRNTHGVAQIFYVRSSNGGSDTVKVTPSIGNASFLEVFVQEYGGTDPNVPLDVTADGQGSSTTPNSGAAATTGTNEVIFGFALLTHPGGAGAGFTARETYGGDVSEDEMASSTGSYSALFTQPATGEWIALMAAFKASSGASNPTVASVTLNPTTVVGGNSSQGTVTLSGPAPTSGATVMLTSSSGSAMVPLSITIGSGMTSGTFTVNTSTVSTPTQATITASYDGTQTAILVINSVSGTQTVFVQGAANYGTGVGSISAGLGSPVTSGHLLVAAVGYSDSTNIPNVTFTVTDSLGNTWTSAMTPVRRNTHGVAQIFYVRSSNGGSDTVKVTPSIGNASFLEVFVQEYGGTDPNAPLDVTANGQGSSTTPNSGAATTTGTNEVIFGFALLTHPGGAGAGFTARETYGGDVSEDEMASSIGSYSALFTQPATGEWIALMAAFRTQGNLESIALTPANGSIGTGAVIQLTATAEFDNSSSADVTNSATWSSSDTVAATINSTGLVTALAPGSATIQASWNGVIGSTNLTITQSQSNFLGVLTQHNDNGRTGQNLNEIALAPTNVQVNTFGKLFSAPVDGFVYVQPLYVPNVPIGGSIHNVVYVATEADSVYAFDADTGAQLWRASLIDQAHGTITTEVTVNVPQDVDPSCNDSASPVGITGTPVIDPLNGFMYVVAKSKTADPMFPTVFIQRLHMLDITSGAEKSPGPAIIAPTVPGHSDGGTTVTFDPLQQINRAGLLFSNGQVFLAYGAHCDEIPYHGWLLAYDAKALTQTAAFVTTPDNSAMQGGIWLGGAGIAADAAGTIFTAIGNGPFDSTDFGDTIVKLALNGSTFSMGDSFTPWDQSNDQGLDLDVGSNGVILLPDQSGPYPHLLIAGAKNGMIYLINRDQFTANNQHYCSNCSSDPQIVQEFHGDANGNTLFGTPAFWNGMVYVGVDHNSLDAFKIQNGQINTTPASTTNSAFPFPGVTPSISASGNTNGIVWVIDSVSGGARLRAFDATNLASELWNSNLAANNRDHARDYVKRAVPTIANGKVYIGTQEELDVYGLLP